LARKVIHMPGAELLSSHNQEVDFILTRGKKWVVFEIKSARRPTSLLGVDAFEKEFGKVTKLLIGGQGMPLEEFFLTPAGEWAK